ncbi:MAG: hypothetical protein Q7W30_10850 [Coriobacteriia bacterium]|nr:hypothetical protein [Coriobacteriia bacterium]
MKRIALIVVLVAAVIFGIVAYASAGTSDSKTVTVNATVNPMLTLTVSTATVDFGVVDPEMTYTKNVTVTVKSNKKYDISKTMGVNAASIGLSTSFADKIGEARGTTAYPDTYTLFVPFTAGDGALTTTVQYSAVQQP